MPDQNLAHLLLMLQRRGEKVWVLLMQFLLPLLLQEAD